MDRPEISKDSGIFVSCQWPHVVDYSLSDRSSVIFDVHSDYRVVLQDSTVKCICDLRKLDLDKFKEEFNNQAF
jgi:hypothetical protein